MLPDRSALLSQQGVSENPFMIAEKMSGKQLADAARDAAVKDYEQRRERGRGLVAASGAQIGSDVRITWGQPTNFGGGSREHVGRVLELSDWIMVEGSSMTPGELYMPVASIGSISLNEQPAITDNPFMS